VLVIMYIIVGTRMIVQCWREVIYKRKLYITCLKKGILRILTRTNRDWVKMRLVPTWCWELKLKKTTIKLSRYWFLFINVICFDLIRFLSISWLKILPFIYFLNRMLNIKESFSIKCWSYNNLGNWFILLMSCK
jgi:hypothetical protein